MHSTKKLFFYFILLFFSTVHANTPPPLQLANIYHDKIDLTDYWVSEKLDGVRAYWNGKQLISKQGHIIHAPAWFTKHFPTKPLDGELWIGRKQFELVSGIIRQIQPDDIKWQHIRYMVFDLPSHSGNFTQRLKAMQKIIVASHSPYLQLVTQYKVANHQELMQQLDIVINNGGEGLMLHQGDSLYQAVRNNDILKVKTFADAEAIVIAHIEGQGKYTGMMGALLVENNDKQRFKIGTGFSDAQRHNPPAIGSTITYKYFGKTNNNLPRFASFVRIREDF